MKIQSNTNLPWVATAKAANLPKVPQKAEQAYGRAPIEVKAAPPPEKKGAPEGPSGIVHRQPSRLEEFHKAFGAAKGDDNYVAEFDFDQDGEIGPGDFNQLARVAELNKKPSLEQIQKVFGTAQGDEGFDARLDLDGDGEIGPGDFDLLAKSNLKENANTAFALQRFNRLSENMTKDALTAFDFNNDGQVDKGDRNTLNNILNTLYA